MVPPTNGSGNAGGGQAALNDLMSALVQPAHRRICTMLGMWRAIASWNHEATAPSIFCNSLVPLLLLIERLQERA